MQGEELVGARAWRVLFGVVSLPLAVTAVAYFINHRYDGVQLWDIKVANMTQNMLCLNFLMIYRVQAVGLV